MTFITADAVADMIGMTKTSFLRARDRLEKEDGLPCPLPTCRRPLRWRRDAIENWVASQGLSRAEQLTEAAAIAAGPNVILMKKAAGA